jgi:hypothetical protein
MFALCYSPRPSEQLFVIFCSISSVRKQKHLFRIFGKAVGELVQAGNAFTGEIMAIHPGRWFHVQFSALNKPLLSIGHDATSTAAAGSKYNTSVRLRW